MFIYCSMWKKLKRALDDSILIIVSNEVTDDIDSGAKNVVAVVPA